jgi:hypothetical protein
MYGVYVVIAMNIFQEAVGRGNRIFSMLTPSYQRTAPVVCRNCIHFLPKEAAYPFFDIGAYDECKKFAVAGSTPGNVTRVNANNERASGRCGPNGIYYQPRKDFSEKKCKTI